METALPSSLTMGATLQGKKWGWTITAFPQALKTAETLRLACLGGQFQFRNADFAWEMYWLCADAHDMRSDESWQEYVHRSCAEVSKGFDCLIQATDFDQQALQWPSLLANCAEPVKALVFVGYFVAEEEYLLLRSKNI